jgi:hypothetical protein
VWEALRRGENAARAAEVAIDFVLQQHNADYEHWWNVLTQTEKKILIGLVQFEFPPTSQQFMLETHLTSTSTVHSALKKLKNEGYCDRANGKTVVQNAFFCEWIRRKRK